MTQAKYLLNLTTKFAETTEELLQKDKLYEKLSRVLHHGHLPYIDYTGDHNVFDKVVRPFAPINTFEVSALLMESPTSYAHKNHNRKILTPQQFDHMIHSFVQELKAVMPQVSKVRVVDVTEPSSVAKEIFFFIPKPQTH
jgi:hypothetical protein